MVVIEKLVLRRKYRYLWLKYVQGIDLGVHCARCLVGAYSKAVNATDPAFENLCLPEQFTGSDIGVLIGVEQVFNMPFGYRIGILISGAINCRATGKPRWA